MTAALLILAALMQTTAPATQPADGWEAAADARIEEHRKGDFTLDLGPAAAGETVRVELARHAFPFGSAVAARLLVELPEGHPYKTHFAELFNRGAVENYHKWVRPAGDDQDPLRRPRQAGDRRLRDR